MAKEVERMNDNKKTNNNKTTKIIIFLGAITCIFGIVLIVVGFIGKIDDFDTTQETISKDTLEDNKNKNTGDNSSDKEKPKVEEITALIIGVDESKGLADTVMIANFNPKDNTIKFISIPRDLYINFNDFRYSHIKEENDSLKISYCKLTEVYSNAGNDEKAITTLKKIAEEIVGIPMEYYVKVDLDGFRAIIDLVDGIEIDVPQNLDYDDWSQGLHIHLKKGLQVLDGEKAEQLVRCRYGYIDGDMGRIRMQQAVLKVLGKKVLGIKNPIKIIELVKEGYKYIETDFTLMDGIKYIKYLVDINVEDIFKEENMVTIPTGGEKIDDIWYEIQYEEKTKEILDKLFNK